MSDRSASFISRVRRWEREIIDALVIYSISILASIATFYSDFYADFLRAQQGFRLEQFAVITLFLGTASAVFGCRRIADQRIDRVRRIAAEQQAASLSLRDPLTLLPNRRSLEIKLRAELDRASSITILLLGLKQFHNINSVFGHASGDAVLSQVAARLRLNVETIGFLARIGDDEFAILITSEQTDRATGIAASLTPSWTRTFVNARCSSRISGQQLLWVGCICAINRSSTCDRRKL
jgi:diguanylate cyclase (GGDEF)-like protein